MPHVKHEIDDQWDNEDLNSLSSGDEEEEVVKSRKVYPKFYEEDMCADFKFKEDMEFSSIKQFKWAVIEHRVLSGREIGMLKNDKGRCRVYCRKEHCKLLILCSRVRNKETY